MSTASPYYYEWVDHFIPRRMHGSVTHNDIRNEKDATKPVKGSKKKNDSEGWGRSMDRAQNALDLRSKEDLKSKEDSKSKNMIDVGKQGWRWSLDRVDQVLDNDFK